MIYPIVAYGDPVLRKKAEPVAPDYPDLPQLIENMFRTMYSSEGVGLAAPQIGKSIRLFVIDGTPFSDEDPSAGGFKKVFINAEILQEDGDKWKMTEGCLSIPGIREGVERHRQLVIRYQDADFVTHTETYAGIRARIIQHEYDHIEGLLFIDRLPAIKKTLLKSRLNDISRGKTDASYKMRFYSRR